MKKVMASVVSLCLIFSLTSCGTQTINSATETSNVANDSQNTATTLNNDNNDNTNSNSNKSAEEIVSGLTLEQKASQMVQPAIYNVTPELMQENCYGSILSKLNTVDCNGWKDIVDEFQSSALQSDAGIPYLYGNDDVHGVNYCKGAVIFPHNIGIGAANDPELTYQMGLAVADEAKMCHMLWNFSPCIAQSQDPRWGRTYESYGSDLDTITTLSTSYTKGLIDGGIIACAKHFFADGNVEYGTGEQSDADRLIDRGNSTLTDDEINALLDVYQAQIDAGVQTIMISHSALNGVKMHENAKYIQYLKNDMHFNGFIVSDWNSVQNTSPDSYDQQIITAVNAGIDMLMEVDTYNEARDIIIDAVNNGEISQERVDDAVTRIIKVKLAEGIFDDPMCENLETKYDTTGSDEYRQLARQLVQKSLVLIKNDENILPLKSGMTIYVTGPACDSAKYQCGGWTNDWNESSSDYIDGVTTILSGMQDLSADAGITITTNPADAQNADAVVLFVGERSYAEWLGDTADLQLCGDLGLYGNSEAIEEAKALNKPTVACVVAGRQVIINDYYDDWDAVVMCYLPGSEGEGVADVLYGNAEFSGKLPSPWYSSISQIGTDDCWLEKGYGLTYNK